MRNLVGLAFFLLLQFWEFHQVLAIYKPLRQHAGSDFFDGFAFYGNVDNTTWGNVTYQDRENATSKSLAYVNGAGNAIIKVDNTTTLTAGPAVVNRDSIRLTSLDSYGIGSLVIIDALHIPYGCSVWPSFWTYGIEQEWPLAGEIDIIEAINGMDHNQIALHTTPGCFQGQPAPQSGSTLVRDCSTNQGCIVAETKPNSFGVGFAQAGGGVYALQIEASGIYVWFFGRADIPANLQNAAPSDDLDISSWGLPTAAYPASGCDITKFFPPQNLVLLTTLCGVWAGVPSIYRSSCPGGTGSCFADNVLGPGSNFDNAYWEVRYIRAYLADDSPGVSSTPSSTIAATSDSGLITVTTVVVAPASSAPTSGGLAAARAVPMIQSTFLGLFLTCLVYLI